MVPSLMMAFKVQASTAALVVFVLTVVLMQISLNDSTKEWNLYNGANVRVRDVKVRFERKCT